MKIEVRDEKYLWKNYNCVFGIVSLYLSLTYITSPYHYNYTLPHSITFYSSTVLVYKRNK